eukprot:CAMPEP_0184044280 /NCGR_PEP_ID=MMETSP0956-20121227/185_1 /TAXON_ID=627963 /ORGANISM="Aplanochytrium sp, Strain PBS07" /LENGTH=311 /DNA_ID=CAMNT_0026335279 /DNA_START=228 /DNA_END=1163 /DNA_ORIENTATION=-
MAVSHSPTKRTFVGPKRKRTQAACSDREQKPQAAKFEKDQKLSQVKKKVANNASQMKNQKQLSSDHVSLDSSGKVDAEKKLRQLEVISIYRAGRGKNKSTVDDFHKFLLSLKGPLGRYWALIGCLLSVQCRDVVALRVIQSIMIEHPEGPNKIMSLRQEEVEELCKSCNFYKTKAKNIQLVTKEIVEKHNGNIPTSYKKLISFPGVGPKIANLMCSVAFSQDDVGIVVDTHVHRISNCLGWVKETKSPEETRLELEKWVPAGRWTQFSLDVVGFGQCTRQSDWIDHFLRQFSQGTSEMKLAQEIVSLIKSS